MLVPPDRWAASASRCATSRWSRRWSRCATSTGYDFRITGNRVFIYSNAVQTRLFRVNYLPGRARASDVRITSSSITQAGVGSANGSNGNSGSNSNNNSSNGNNNGSSGIARACRRQRVVRTTSTPTSPWREVQQALTTMVGSRRGRGVVMKPGRRRHGGERPRRPSCARSSST